jgi:prevent-host-death family protein
MNAITLKTAKENLENVIATTIANQDETIIVTDKGSVVMIDEKNWERINETLRLLRDKKSLQALIEGYNNRDAGIVAGKTIEEVFANV